MKPIVVTGAAGFIASQVSRLLLESGRPVIGLDNINDAYDPSVKHWRLKQLQKMDGFRFAELNIENRDALLEGLEVATDGESPEAVINLAARAGVRQSVARPELYVDCNITGTLNLLEYCRRADVGKFILASTSSLYGAHNPLPFSEDADTNGPLSPYAASKKGAEALAYSYHYLHGIDVTVFRYFTVYGPAGRPDMSVFRFIKWVSEGEPLIVYGDGTQGRDFTYVGDIARGTVAGLKRVGYEVINLGSDHPVGLMDMLHEVEDLVGKKAKIEHRPFQKADVMRTWANVSKAKRLLGWEPQVTLTEGLRNAVEWYKDNRDWAKDVETDDRV